MEFFDEETYLQDRNDYLLIGNLENSVLKVHTPDCATLQKAVDEEKHLLSYRKFGFHSIDDAYALARRNGWTVTALCHCQQVRRAA